MDAEHRAALVANRKRRRVAAVEFARARTEFLRLVKRALAADVPMTEIAKVAQMDRRAIYDLLKHKRQPRGGAGAERNAR